MSTTLALIGDVMLGRGVSSRMAHKSPEWFWGDTLGVLRAADAVIANLECAITTGHRRWLRTPKAFHFAAEPRAVDVLTAAGISYVSLANNHTLDYETEGLLDTLRYLDAAGIAHAGAGATWEQAAAPAMIDAGPITLGIISATDNEPAFAAGNDAPGTHYIQATAHPATLIPIGHAAADLRRRGADMVILSLHWGANLVMTPPPQFRHFAPAGLNCGVDIIHGHSAHVVQGVQIVDRRPILYNTGAFLDDYAIDGELHNDWSAIFLLDIDDTVIHTLRIVPVELSFTQVNLATGSVRDAIAARLTSLCNELGTPVTQTDEGLEITVAQPARTSG